MERTMPDQLSAGVICEFNPIHNGHVRLLSAMREAIGPEGCVICLMSGRFVQRGTPALADPYLRAHMALCAGADLVLELPFPWSAAGAEIFAAAGVNMLARLGVNRLAFGSETGALPLLETAARAVAEPDFQERCAALIRDGAGSAAAYVQTVREACQTDMSLARKSAVPADFPASNDLLAINYLCALRKNQMSGGYMPPLVVRREGQAYRDQQLQNPAAPSASALRTLIQTQMSSEDGNRLAALLEGSMPPDALTLLLSAVRKGQLPTREDALLPYFHVLFRTEEPDTLSRIAELSGGLAQRMIKAARSAGTPEVFLASLHSKLYPDARLRRGMLFAAAGVSAEDLKFLPAYTTLLAANANGCRYLRALKKKTDLPVVTKPADAPAGRQRALADRADALFTLCLPTPAAADVLSRACPVIVKL